MKVLFAVSECVPFVKSGGLADVAGSLPKELLKQGTDVRVILPKYGAIREQFKEKMTKQAALTVNVGWRSQYCGIESFTHEGIIFYFIDNEYYFKRDQLYGYFDDGERFAYFNRAVLESLKQIGFIPDIIHCHDWHTGMIPFLLKTEYQHKSGFESIRSVFTIHNLQFQGILPRHALDDLFGISDLYFHSEALEFYGNINVMKGGITAADKITTVSPTYRNEIQMEYYGEKLHGLLRKRSSDLQGILNGIDDDFYNPADDPFLYKNYNVSNLTGKAVNKKKLQRQFGLPVQTDTPIIAMVTRLTKQKGLDLVKHVLHELLQDDVQILVLGTGDKEFEHFFSGMEHAYPNKCKAYIGFDEELAHQIYAGADLFLMPSKFEPCGLGQMIAMRYGTIPIVRETGGLNDTVISYDPKHKEGNGFTFTNFNAHDMLYTIRRAIKYYHSADWEKIVFNAMELDHSWAQSAFQYNQLYASLISRSESHVF